MSESHTTTAGWFIRIADRLGVPVAITVLVLMIATNQLNKLWSELLIPARDEHFTFLRSQVAIEQGTQDVQREQVEVIRALKASQDATTELQRQILFEERETQRVMEGILRTLEMTHDSHLDGAARPIVAPPVS